MIEVYFYCLDILQESSDMSSYNKWMLFWWGLEVTFGLLIDFRRRTDFIVAPIDPRMMVLPIVRNSPMIFKQAFCLFKIKILTNFE